MTDTFGQFDNYTTMQLAQYAATVRKRVSPHVVEGIYDNNDQGAWSVEKAIETKELNRVHISAEDMALIKQGVPIRLRMAMGWRRGKTVSQRC